MHNNAKAADISTKDLLHYLTQQNGLTLNIHLSEIYPDMPLKVVIAKMRKLINKGWVDGCACGCRGDYEITNEGHKALREMW